MENLIRELKQAIENFNLYLKNEYTTINNKIQGISNDISDYSVFTLSQVKAKDLKINLTFPRATYVMAVIKNASSSTYVELSINQPTKEKLKFYDGSFHKGIIRDLYLSYDFSNLEVMPEVKIYVGYNSTFNPITSVRLADVTSENPLPVNIIDNTADESSKFTAVISKQLELLLEAKADEVNQKLLAIIATPKNALITVTIDGITYTSKGYFNKFVDEDKTVTYQAELANYQTISGTVVMNKHQVLDLEMFEPRTLRIAVTNPSSNVNIAVTTENGTQNYSQDTGNLILKKNEHIHYTISDTNSYPQDVVGADGYATKEGDLVLKEDTNITETLVPSYTVKFNLSGQALPYGSDTITVKDGNDNLIVGATVNIRNLSDNSLVNSYTTDDNGIAVISELADEYKIEISKIGYGSYNGQITIEKNVDNAQTIILS